MVGKWNSLSVRMGPERQWFANFRRAALPALPGPSMKKQADSAGSLFYGLPVGTKLVVGIKTKIELE